MSPGYLDTWIPGYPLLPYSPRTAREAAPETAENLRFSAVSGLRESGVIFDFLRGSKGPASRKPVPSPMTVPVFLPSLRANSHVGITSYSLRRSNVAFGDVVATVGYLTSPLPQAWTGLLLRYGDDITRRWRVMSSVADAVSSLPQACG